VTSIPLPRSDRAYPAKGWASAGAPKIVARELSLRPLPPASHEIVPRKSYSKRGSPCPSTTMCSVPVALC
jgi:hypothetical protein